MQVRELDLEVGLAAFDRGLQGASGPRGFQCTQCGGVTAQGVQPAGSGRAIAPGQVGAGLGGGRGELGTEAAQETQEEGQVSAAGGDDPGGVDAGDLEDGVVRGGGARSPRLAGRGAVGRGTSRLPAADPMHQGLGHLADVERLGQDRVDPGGARRLLFAGQDPGGQGNDGQGLKAEFAADDPGGGQSIHDRHAHVHQHGVVVVGPGAQQGDGLLAVRGQGDPGPLLGERALDQVAVHGAVVDHQQVGVGEARAGGGRRPVGLCRGRDRGGPREGDLEPEGAAAARLALHADAPLHEFDQTLADGEPEPGPAEAPRDPGLGLGEGGE